MAVEVPEEIKATILGLKQELYTKGSIVREIKKITKDKELAKQYVDLVLGERNAEFTANPQLRRDEGKNLMKSSVIGLVVSLPFIFLTRLALIVSAVAVLSFIVGAVKYFGGLK